MSSSSAMSSNQQQQLSSSQQNSYMDTGTISKTFKIRKTKAKVLQQIQDRQQVQKLEHVDINRIKGEQTNQQRKEQSIHQELQPKQYEQDQEDINCYRFPHSSFCGCQSNCLLESFDPIQIMPCLHYGNFVTGLKIRHLLDLGVTHIVNVTSKQYTKRNKYFEYLNIDLHYNTQEDAKKFFRISNRFISSAIRKGGKVFVHSSVLELGAVIIIGYLIGVQKISFKQGLQIVMQNGMELTPHFLKQIESYDLEKMAFVSIHRE